MAQTYPPIPESPTAAPKSGMSTTTKVILGILAVIGVCCALSVVGIAIGGVFLRGQVEEAVQTPDQAAATGQSIINYDLPSGYSEQTAMSLFGMDMVFITEGSMDDGGMFIMLARFDIPGMTEADTDTMQSQMEQGMSGSNSSSGVDFSPVDSRDITINGGDSTLAISEGEDESGNLLRQATAAFVSDGKPAMVMFIGPVNGWDDDGVEEFLASIE